MPKQPANQRPLNVMFLLTSMPVGGAETLLFNMVRKFDRRRIQPMIACLKQRDELGEKISAEIPVFERLIRHKYDLTVVPRLKKLFRDNGVDAVITVGAGDKMFWGRLAAWWHGVPVIFSALHSTGGPDGVGKLNRLLTPVTDGFIAVARQHAEFQITQEQFPESKVFLIPNGIDVERFQLDSVKRRQWRETLQIPSDSPVVSLVAALRPEKNHRLFLEVAKRVAEHLPNAQFVIAGDGPLKGDLKTYAQSLGIADKVHFPGCVDDVPGILSMSDLFALTSDNEASPVSIMEALSCRRPVVAPSVGSINETVIHGETGFLFDVGNADQAVEKWLAILTDKDLASRMGEAGRTRIVQGCSLEAMTEGYTILTEKKFAEKSSLAISKQPNRPGSNKTEPLQKAIARDASPVRSA